LVDTTMNQRKPVFQLSLITCIAAAPMPSVEASAGGRLASSGGCGAHADGGHTPALP